ncbi:MAG: aldo/keto reductase [Erysipelotrichaceae bacterium]
MRYKKFGNTGLELSELTLGTWAISGDMGPVDEKTAFGAIDAMIDYGCNFIDTAPTYGRGAAEELLGKALKNSGKRDKVTLLTKCGIRWPDGPKDFSKGSIRDSSYDALMKQIDQSLERLQTDYIDIYLIHWPDVNTPIEETLRALKEMKQAGKIRYTGVSNFEEPLLSKIYEAGMLDVIQYEYNALNRTREDLLKNYSEKGVATMGYGSLGGGILTGKIREIPNFDSHDARKGFYGKFYDEKVFPKVMKMLETADSISAERNVPVAQIFLNWALKHEFLHTSLTGVTSAEIAKENTEAMNWQLTDDEFDRINKALKVMEND